MVPSRALAVASLMAAVGLLVPNLAGFTAAEAENYCLACIAPPEGKSGIYFAEPNVGNRLDLFFLTEAGELVSSATTENRLFDGERMGASSIAGNGSLFGRANDVLLLNQALSQGTVADLAARTRSLDLRLGNQWKVILKGMEYSDHARRVVLDHQPGKQAQDRYYAEAMQVCEGRNVVSPRGDAMWSLLHLRDEKSLSPRYMPLFFNILLVKWFDKPDSTSLLVGADGRWRLAPPSWSPDGTMLAFYRIPAQTMQRVEELSDRYVRVEGWQPCVVDTRSGELKTYAPKSCVIYGTGSPPCWSPDQTRVLISMSYDDPTSLTRYGSKGIFLIDLKTGKCERLSTPSAREWAISWAPTGDRYLYFTMQPLSYTAISGPRLYGVGQINPPSRKVLIDATARDVRDEVTWSPDGKYLAFCAVVKEGDAWVDTINVIESSGAGKAREIVRSKPHLQGLSRRYMNLTFLELPAK